MCCHCERRRTDPLRDPATNLRERGTPVARSCSKIDITRAIFLCDFDARLCHSINSRRASVELRLAHTNQINMACTVQILMSDDISLQAVYLQVLHPTCIVARQNCRL